MTKAESKAVATRTESTFLEMVERIAANPDIDAEKVDQLLKAQERVLDRQARNAFYDAMQRVQANLPVVVKDAVNDQTQSMYAKLETISRIITPIYTAEGFSASFSEKLPESRPEGEMYIHLHGVLRHREGHAEDYDISLPIDMTGIKGTINKTKVHGAGSTFTYARRYLKCLMFDVAVGDDTDGNIPMNLDPITAEQAEELETLLTETNSDMEKFLKWVHAETLYAIPAAKFDECVAALDRKRSA